MPFSSLPLNRHRLNRSSTVSRVNWIFSLKLLTQKLIVTYDVCKAVRKRTEIAIGNIIGSCIFNITFVLGVGAAINDLTITEQVRTQDIWWLVGLGMLMLPLMIRGRSLGRLDGIFLMIAFVIYYAGLFLL